MYACFAPKPPHFAHFPRSTPHFKETMGTHNDEAGSSRSKWSRQHETVEEMLLPQIYHKFLLWKGCHRDAKSRMGYDREIDDMLRIRLREAELDEEIFTSVAWIRAFNINEPIYAELCLEICMIGWVGWRYAKREPTTHLGILSRSMTSISSAYPPSSTTRSVIIPDDDEYCRDTRVGCVEGKVGVRGAGARLGLYLAVELEEDGFNVYFEGGLRSDDNFNATNYSLSISQGENLSYSRSHTSTIRNSILRVIHKMITYGLYQRTTGYDKKKEAGTQKESQICCGQFISKLAMKCRVLTEDVVRSLSAPIYCRDLDTSTLRDLIDYDGKLIPEDPQSGVPRVGIPRPPRASMQDLYDRMGHMEIRQDAIERMEYRQSYH
ncbi:hypothetical protein Tco_1014956 [Tanacetum coccineum]